MNQYERLLGSSKFYNHTQFCTSIFILLKKVYFFVGFFLWGFLWCCGFFPLFFWNLCVCKLKNLLAPKALKELMEFIYLFIYYLFVQMLCLHQTFPPEICSQKCSYAFLLLSRAPISCHQHSNSVPTLTKSFRLLSANQELGLFEYLKL